MKKIFTFLFLGLATIIVYGQAIQRTMVIQEIGTGTWCQYCPGAAMGADDLIANGCAVAVVEYHNGDSFTNTASDARNNYYGITGFPTSFFDGVLSYVGGNHTTSMYSNYLPLYNQRHAIPSPLAIDISGTSAGNTYNIVLSIHKLAAITSTDLKAHLVLTESNIQYAWQGQTELNYVERKMVPDENGTALSFTSGDMQIITLSFTKDASWVTSECELVAFVQDNGTKEILNGNKVMLTALPSPMPVDFAGAPTTGCVPVTTNFTDQSSGATGWQWNFPGGTPTSSSVQNPSVSYTTAGTNDVTLTAWNLSTGRGNKITKAGYVSVSGAPAAPGQPQGSTAMCQNPGNQVYSTSGSPGAASYTWDLQPVSSGTLTNNGTTCTIAWSSSFTGNATLKVQGTSACGTGPWSAPLTITISTVPSQPGTPMGSTQLCQNPPNNTYTSTGATPATSHIWEIIPSSAGTLTNNGSMVTVDWSAIYIGTAQLHLAGINGGCQGPWSEFINITVNTGPQIYSVNGGGTYCGPGGTGLPVNLDGSEAAVNYTLYLNGTPTSTVVTGTGSAISFGNQLTAGTYTVVANNPTTTCSMNMNASVVINVDPQAPETPATPDGITNVHTGSTPTTDYITTGGTYATTYAWTLTPANAGTISGTGSTGTATWDNSFIGTAHVSVQGVNTCGGGSFSTELVIEVDNTVGISEKIAAKYISIFPNPAKDELNFISGKKVKADIRLYNTLGKLVATINGQDLSSGYKMNIASIVPGIYFVSIDADGVHEIQKVVVE